MITLALDFGTDTGIAFGPTESPRPEIMRTHNLATPKEIAEWGKTRMTRRNDPRIERLYYRLLVYGNPPLVIFEDVQFQSYTYQCQLWSSFRAAAWLAFPKAVFECVPVGTLKKFATGSGHADKKMMAASLFKCDPTLKSASLSDDAIDAIWLWKWAKEKFRI